MYYILKDVAALTGIPARRIQFWVKENVVIPARISTKRGIAHEFSKRNVLEFYVTQKLSDFGFSLFAIKGFISAGLSDWKKIVLSPNVRGGEVYYLHIIDSGNDDEPYSGPCGFISSTDSKPCQLEISIKSLKKNEIQAFSVINLSGFVDLMKI